MEQSRKRTLLFRAVLAVLALLAIGSAATMTRVRAQAKPAETALQGINNSGTLNAQLQYSTITGTTNTINATYVPLTTASGTLAYENLTIPLSVTQNSQGAIQVEAGPVAAVPSPLPQTNGFIAGNYVGPGGGTAQLITLSGPGITANGATEWSVAQSPGATSCTWPQNATFYVGPLENNPLYARIQAAGITSTAYSYGVMGSQTCGSGGDYWVSGNLIGFVQNGNAITIVSFTYGADEDFDVPNDPITYTLISQ
jgi:hypothetical protein